jgi:copper(I)-binding protein
MPKWRHRFRLGQGSKIRDAAWAARSIENQRIARFVEALMRNYLRAQFLFGAGAALALTMSPFAVAIVAAVPALAGGDYEIGTIKISQPWSRATPKGATAGAGYMTITNNGNAPDKVTCVSDDASAQCQIHSMTMDGGVMKMRPVEGGLEIKPGESVRLQPGGYHVMFRELKHPLAQGQSIKATLKFERAGTVDVDYPVLSVGAAAPDAAPGGAMMQGSGTMKMQGGGTMQMDKH